MSEWSACDGPVREGRVRRGDARVLNQSVSPVSCPAVTAVLLTLPHKYVVCFRPPHCRLAFQLSDLIWPAVGHHCWLAIQLPNVIWPALGPRYGLAIQFSNIVMVLGSSRGL